MTTTKRWTVDEAEAILPDDGRLFEIIDGELEEMKAPDFDHQGVVTKLSRYLDEWNSISLTGYVRSGIGIVFGDEDGVIPDVVWVSKERFTKFWRSDKRKLYGTPELVIEVLSPGNVNATRDRDTKRDLYERRGADEYWILDWHKKVVEIYHRIQNRELAQVAILHETDSLTSSVLPGFTCPVKDIFSEVLSE